MPRRRRKYKRQRRRTYPFYGFYRSWVRKTSYRFKQYLVKDLVELMERSLVQGLIEGVIAYLAILYTILEPSFTAIAALPLGLIILIATSYSKVKRCGLSSFQCLIARISHNTSLGLTLYSLDNLFHVESFSLSVWLYGVYTGITLSDIAITGLWRLRVLKRLLKWLKKELKKILYI